MSQEIIIDAKMKKVGRLASSIAKALRGKMKPDFAPHRTDLPHVVVTHVDQLSVSLHKLKSTLFQRYSGYPSGRHVVSAHTVAKKDMREVLKHAVWGMLPKNKLRKRMMKNLVLYHGDKN